MSMNANQKLKVLVLISSGIDSAVAAYLMRDCDIQYLHFNKNSENKVAKIIKKLSGTKFYVVEHEEIIKRIIPLNPGRSICIYCKAAMFITAEILANKIGCEAVVTGDNLGQVASQTLQNMKSEESAVRIPILRPLAGLDKMEIVEIAKKIGTYNISIEGEDYCPYAPKHPTTEGCKIDKISEDENIKDVFKDILKHIRLVNL